MVKERITNWYGKKYDFNTIIYAMDRDIRDKLYRDIGPCDSQTFFDDYCVKHYEVLGENFEYDTRKACEGEIK